MPDSNPDPSELHGLDPGELLARGMHTVRFSGTVHDWTPPSPEDVARLLPQYRIESLLGRGGMGAVYKGFQEKLARAVAIKILPSELTADEQFVTRFEREARTLARLQHSGIVAIYDFGKTTDGHLFFVMEFVEGTDLRRVLEGPGLEPGQALEIITQICEALHAAHRQGVIHRDIKPANILITTDGRVKLADFGLARPEHEEREALTMTNAVLGTPDYMAPEQREGRSDSRVDIYALGVMLYEMLTGQLPRGAWTPPSRRVQVDVRIDEVVLKALQHEPEQRYQQASEMKTDVESIRTGPAETAAKPGSSRREKWIALLSVVAAIAALASAAFWALEKSRHASAGGAGAKASMPLRDEGAAAVPASLAVAVEKPIPGCPLLRRFEFPDSDSGLSKVTYLPAKPGYGLILRYTCAVDFLDDEDLDRGFDETTVWDWVQVPPLDGKGENTLTVAHGTPVWQTDGTETERITSGMDISEDLFWGEKIPINTVTFRPRPDRVECTLTRERVKGDPATKETFLHYEIIAVPQAELKRMYPQMRGPGETSGESATWVYPPVDGAKWKAAAEKATVEFPGSADKWRNYGWSLFNLGRYVEARAAFQKAADLTPGDPWIMTNLAVASYQAGDEAQALKFYAEAVKRNRNFANWDDALKSIPRWEAKARDALHEVFNKWSAAPSAAPPASTPLPTPESKAIEAAVFDGRWDYVTTKPGYKFSHSLFFEPDGFAYSIGRNTQWRFSWKKTGPRALHLERRRESLDLTFDEKFERFSGTSADGSTVEGRRSRDRSPDDRAMLGNAIGKFSAASAKP